MKNIRLNNLIKKYVYNSKKLESVFSVFSYNLMFYKAKKATDYV